MSSAGELNLGVRNQQNLNALITAANTSNLTIKSNGTGITIDTSLAVGSGGGGNTTDLLTILSLAPIIWGGNPATNFTGVSSIDGGDPTTNFTSQTLDASDNRIGV